MQVREIMTENPACCTPDTPLPEVARRMVQHDCGEIPVVDDPSTRRPVGVITDRDITCRTVAEGKNPLHMIAKECMSTPVVTVTPETSLDSCCKTMVDNQVRRVPVVDDDGGCCGMVSQADIARAAPEHETAVVVKDVSRPTQGSSRVGCC